jgi:hypothetical protein
VTNDTGKGREKYKSGMVRDIRGGKGRFDLISPFAMIRIAQVCERGALKYSDRNWEKGCSFSRFLDSALRHLIQYMTGAEDGEDHLGAAAWNIMAIIHLEELIAHGLKSKELDDLPRYLKHADTRNISQRTVCK